MQDSTAESADVDSCDEDELYDADPNCQHQVQAASGGGVKCAKCTGWFCF
jgi:hypothetical protein